MTIPHLKTWMSEEEDGFDRLRLFEICFALQFLALTLFLFMAPFDWLGRDGLNIDLRPLGPANWKAWPKLPNWGVVVFGAALFGGIAMILKGGQWRRLGLILALACSVYILYADRLSTFTVTRLNVVVFAMLATAPVGPGRLNNPRREITATIWLLRSVLIALYFTSGIAKAFHGDWLRHSDVVLTHFMGIFRTEFSAWLVREMPAWFWTTQQWMALIFELGAPLLFTLRFLRPAAFILGLGFHAFIAICCESIWALSIHCVAYYALFIPAPWFRGLTQFVQKHVGFTQENFLKAMSMVPAGEVVEGDEIPAKYRSSTSPGRKKTSGK